MALLLGEKKSIYGVKNASDLLTKATKMFLGGLWWMILLSKSLMDSQKLLDSGKKIKKVQLLGTQPLPFYSNCFELLKKY